MSIPAQRIPLTGTMPIQLDWAPQLSGLYAGQTISSATWTLTGTGITNGGATTTDTTTTISITTSGLTKGATGTAVVVVTLSGGAVLGAEIPLIAGHLDVQRA